MALGTNAGQNNQHQNSIAIGYEAGQHDLSAFSIAIGAFALNSSPSGAFDVIAIGRAAAATGCKEVCVNIGANAGQFGMGTLSTNVGQSAGRQCATGSTRHSNFGTRAGRLNQGDRTVALGGFCAENNQADRAVALVYDAGVVSIKVL